MYVEISEKASAYIEITKKEERSLARQARRKEKENTCTLIGQHMYVDITKSVDITDVLIQMQRPASWKQYIHRSLLCENLIKQINNHLRYKQIKQ